MGRGSGGVGRADCPHQALLGLMVARHTNERVFSAVADWLSAWQKARAMGMLIWSNVDTFFQTIIPRSVIQVVSLVRLDMHDLSIVWRQTPKRMAGMGSGGQPGLSR